MRATWATALRWSATPRLRWPGWTSYSGPFAWPQITNVHRIEGGGTEFPMMIMDGSADQGLIVHELGTTTPWGSWPTTSGGRLAGRGIHQLSDDLVLGGLGEQRRLRGDRGGDARGSTSMDTPSRQA